MRRPGPVAVRVALAALVTLAATTAAGAPAGAAALPPPKAYIVVDADSGAVIAGDRVHDPLPPASLSKIMTALVAVERIPPDAAVGVSPRAAGQPAMRINMASGQQWPFESVMAALMMVSANDAAYAFAEDAGGGTIDGFADVANATARRLGMHDSTLGDPAGLDDSSSYKGGPRMSAYDLAVATRNALSVPVIATYAALRKYTFTDPAGHKRSLTNHNKMLAGGGYDYAGATGFKTGFTNRSGHTLVATASRSGRNCIAVVLYTADGGYAFASHLLDQCFATPAGAAGTGEHLPGIAVWSYPTRLADQREFAALGGGAVAASKPPAAKEPLATRRAERQSTAARHLGGGLLTLRNSVIVVLLALIAVVALRRRAVTRRRTRRVARRRARAAAMRSGGLTVVDSRYRTGTRVGPPVESHVRVHPVHAEISLGDGPSARPTTASPPRRSAVRSGR